MDSSSSASSSSASQYKGAAFPASSRPRWPDLTIYESSPHYHNGRLPSSSPYSNYASDYANYSAVGARDGGSTAGVAETREEDESMAVVDKEHMFDKVVTPSDVGKLNRLVIPKQHAEKYFPLDSNSGDTKGLLLNFEDRTGKSWRFRYSYWNSSQSYVMTKGWSRFVKEKKLDAGDVVSFHRGIGDSGAKDRFYIDCRRRPDAPPSHHALYRGLHHHHPAVVDSIQFQHGFSFHRPIHPSFYLSPHPLAPPLVHQARDHHHHRGSVVSYNGVTTNSSNYGMVSPNFCNQTGSVIYLGQATTPQHQMPLQFQAASSRRDHMMGAENEVMVFDSVPVVHGGKAASSKRLRLFGVNMDCTDPQNDCDVNQSQQLNHHHHHQALARDSDRISSLSDDSALQLRLHGSGVSAASTSTVSDKGKSSMSLDLDI